MLAALGLGLGAGCAVAPEHRAPAIAVRPVAARAAEAVQARDADGRETRRQEAAAPTATLEAYEVRESAFSDFGMSVRTNLEVKWGGGVAWMLVSAVEPGSSAARRGIVAGDRILAIDGRAVTELGRDAMLDVLFHRKKGEAARMLVLAQGEALPRFLTLVASPPGR